MQDLPDDGDCIHWGRSAFYSMNRPESLWAKGDTIKTPMSLAISMWQIPIRCINTLYYMREMVHFFFPPFSSCCAS